MHGRTGHGWLWLALALPLAACGTNPFLPDTSRPSLRVSWQPDPAEPGRMFVIRLQSSDADLQQIQGAHSYGGQIRWPTAPPGMATLSHGGGYIMAQFPLAGAAEWTFRVDRFQLDSSRPTPQVSDWTAPVVQTVALAEPPRRDRVRIVFTAVDNGPAGLLVRDTFHFRALDNSGNPSRAETVEVAGCRAFGVWTPSVGYGPSVICEFAYAVGPDRFELVFNPSVMGGAAAFWGQEWRLVTLSLYDLKGNSEHLSTAGGDTYYSSVRGLTSIPIVEAVVP